MINEFSFDRNNSKKQVRLYINEAKENGLFKRYEIEEDERSKCEIPTIFREPYQIWVNPRNKLRGY